MLEDCLKTNGFTDNDPKAVLRAEGLMRTEGLLYLEVGFGSGKMAMREAEAHPDRSYVAFDNSFVIGRDPDMTILDLQAKSPDNIAFLHADMGIFAAFPDGSIDYVVFINPFISMLQQLFRQRGEELAPKLTGELFIKPYEPSPYGDTEYALRSNRHFDVRKERRADTIGIYNTEGAWYYNSYPVEVVFLGKTKAQFRA